MNVKIIPKQMGKNPLNGGGERIWAPFLFVGSGVHSNSQRGYETFRGGSKRHNFQNVELLFYASNLVEMNQ